MQSIGDVVGSRPCSRNEGEMNTNQTFPTGHTSLGRQGETKIWTFIEK